MEDDADHHPITPPPSPEVQSVELAPVELEANRPPQGRRGWGFVGRLTRRIVILTVALAILFVLLYATRERTLHPLLVRVAPPLAKSLAGLHLELRDIDGDWRTGLAIDGFALRSHEDGDLGALTSLAAERAEIRGSILGLLRGRTSWNELETIQLKSPNVVLDFTGPPSESSAGSDPPFSLPTLPHVEVQGGTLEIKLDNDTLRFKDIAMIGAGEAAAPLIVETYVSADRWRAQVTGDLVRESPEKLAFAADVPAGAARSVDLELHELAGSWSPSETRIERGLLIVGANEVRPRGVVIRDGALGWEVGGHLSFDFQDLQDAHRATCAFQGVDEHEGWSGTVRGTVDLVPMPGQVATGNISLTGENLITSHVDLGSVTAFATADERGIYLQELLASDGDGSQARASGALLADWRTLEEVRIAVQLERPASVHGALDSVRGLRATIELDGDIDDPAGKFELRAEQVAVGGLNLEDVTADGTLDGGIVDLSGIHVKSEFGEASAAVRGNWPTADQPLDVVLQALTWERKGARLELTQPVPIHLSEGAVRIDDLRLVSGEGHAELDFDSHSDEGLALDLNVVSLEIEPFVEAFAPHEGFRLGTLHGTAKIRAKETSIRGATGHVDLTLERSPNIADGKIAARILADWRDDRIDFKDVVIELPAAQLQLAGTAPLSATGPMLSPGDVSLQARLGVDAQALTREPLKSLLPAEAAEPLSRTSGRSFAHVDLGGQWKALRGTLEVNLEEARIEPPQGREPLLPEAVSGTLAILLGDTIELQPSGLRLGDTAAATVKASLGQSLDATALWEDPAGRLDSWMSAPLEANADLNFHNMAWLARFLPELRETSGTLTGTCSVHGTARDLQPSGTLVLENGGARYRGLPPLEKAHVEVALDPAQIQITRADMEIGAAPVSLKATILHDQDYPRIDAAITGSDVLLARSSEARVRADLDLTLQGRTNALTVGGDIRLVEGRLRSPIEFQRLLSSTAAAPQSVRRGLSIPSLGPESVRLDLNITSEEALSLRGRIARGKIRADMHVGGTADHPTPTGQVYFDPLELAVPAGTITFPTGLVRFEPSNPEVPKIDLVGTTRLAGYNVIVNVDGDYDAPNIDLSSSPPLSPEDLLMLVLSGQPPSRGGGIEAAGQSVAFYVAKDLVRGWFSSGGFEDEDKESFLDRLEVTSGRDVSRSGVLTLEATYKIREGLARDDDAVYVVLERDAYEDYGLGVRFVLRLR